MESYRNGESKGVYAARDWIDVVHHPSSIPTITVGIHEAKTQLSTLVDQAIMGEAFVIAAAGKPLVKGAASGSTAAGLQGRHTFGTYGRVVITGAPADRENVLRLPPVRLVRRCI